MVDMDRWEEDYKGNCLFFWILSYWMGRVGILVVGILVFRELWLGCLYGFF